MNRIIDIENDGLNMGTDGTCLYIRCKRSMFKYDLTDMHPVAHNTVFKKDGKARGFAVGADFIYLRDFCDLYILAKDDLQVVDTIRIGQDLSSDICGVTCDAQSVYLSIRNGQIAVPDLMTKAVERFQISQSSFWGMCVTESRLYAGSVGGELIEIEKSGMRVSRTAALGKKNIYSVVCGGDFIYTVSQDMAIKSTRADTFETVCTAKKAVGGMANLLGIHDGMLFAADSGKVSVWNTDTLELTERFAFPTGSYNNGIILAGGKLFGSDKAGVYSASADRDGGK